MITKIFSVLDIKTGAYMQPFFSATIGSAIRSVSDAAMDPQSMLGRHREDFQLYLMGTFDDATGRITPEEHITPLGSLLEMAPINEIQEAAQ